MPQIYSATPIYLEQRINEFYSDREIEHSSNNLEPPPKFNSEASKNDGCYSLFGTVSDEDRLFSGCDPNVITENCFQVTKNESDSGCGSGSDEEDRLNSGLSFVSDDQDPLNSGLSSVCDDQDRLNLGLSSVSDEEDRHNLGLTFAEGDSNNITVPVTQLNTADSFDFWNKTSSNVNNIKHQNIKKSADRNSVTKSVTKCNDHDIQSSFSHADGDFLNLLTGDLNVKNSDLKRQYAQTLKSLGQKTVNNSDCDLSFYDLFNDISSKPDTKIVNSISFQKDLLNEKTCYNPFPDKFINSLDNLSPAIDNTYSDLFSSLSSSSCEDDSSILNKAENSNSDKLEKFSTCNDSLLSSCENDDTLSDLLASICVESTNVDEKNNSSFSNSAKLIDAKSNDIEDNKISLASLAEEYLSSKVSNCFLPTSQKDDYIDLTENILNSEKISSPILSPSDNKNTQDLFEMCDLFAAVNEKLDNPDKIYFNGTTTDATLKSELNNLRSQVECSTNENDVALFAEKYFHNDESSEDESDGNIEIDLTSCLKSDKLSSSPLKSLSITKEEIILDANSDLSPLRSSPPLLIQETNEMYSPLLKSKRTKSKPSLFSKALSCKPKKDQPAALKVLSIQKQICERLFNPPQLSGIVKPKKSAICPADDFIFSTLGRRIFEHGKFQEVR